MICRECRQDKAATEFGFRNRAAGVQHTLCRDCKRAYDRRHYHKHIDEYKQRGAVQSKLVRNELLRKIDEYLREHPCVDCGEADPLVFDFDHREQITKRHSISNMRGLCYSWERILEEIAKCDVRCANCHRRRTARQCGWYFPESDISSVD